MNTFTLIALVVLVLILFKARLSGTKSAPSAAPVPKNRRKHSPRKASPRSTFAAVSIKFPEDACLAVRELEGIKFLAWEAPITPLKECSCLDCQCRYVHHDDRRSIENRRAPSNVGGRLGKFEGSRDRRSCADRRSMNSIIDRTEHEYKTILNALVEDSDRKEHTLL